LHLQGILQRAPEKLRLARKKKLFAFLPKKSIADFGNARIPAFLM